MGYSLTVYLGPFDFDMFWSSLLWLGWIDKVDLISRVTNFTDYGIVYSL